MSLRKKDIKFGDSLVCIDRSGLFSTIQYAFKEHWAREFNNESKITKIGDDFIYLTGGFLIHDDQLKYFKKKEQSQYTFDDLIDASSKAVKEGLFASIKTDFKSVIQLKRISECDDDSTVFHNGKHNAENYKYIQSLYKETFVIESEEDIKRIKDNAVVTLLNGHELPAIKARRDEYIELTGVGDFYFLVLKDATVEQVKS